MKKYLLGIFAVLFAVTLSAFTTTPEKKNTVEQKWFVFNGDPGDEMDETQYSVVSAPSCPSTTEALRCEIYIQAKTSNPNLPDIDHYAPSLERKKAE